VLGLLTNTAGTTTNAGHLNIGVAVSGGTVTNSNVVGAGVSVSGTGTYTQTAGITTGGLTNTNIVNANGGALDGAIANNAGGTFNVGGTVTSDNTFNNSTATSRMLVNSGSYAVAGQITNSGTNAAGGILVAAGATLSTSNTITNGAGATMVNNGTVTTVFGTANSGTFTNAGTINGAVGNFSTFTNSGTVNGLLITSAGTYTQTAGSTNGGVINGATINANAGAFNGAIVNSNGTSGTFNIGGTVTSNSTFANDAAGSRLLVNSGSYTVTSLITNMGKDAAGGILVAAGATLTANGGINNNFAATSIDPGSTIINNGIINGNLVANTSTVVNNLTWNGTVNNTFLFNNNAAGTVSGLVTNNNGGAVTTSGTLAGGLVNSGLVFAQGTVNNGIVNNANGGITITGALLTNSIVNNAAGATLIVNNQSFTGVTSYTNAGNTLLGGGGAGTIGATAFNNSGTLTVFSTNNTINGPLNNTGTVNLLGATLGGTPALTVTGSLVMGAAAAYLVQVNPTTASFTAVTGSATLNGGTVSATFANGSYIAKRYTILTAALGVGGTFASVTNTNLPGGFKSSLSYDTNNAYLDLALNFTPPSSPNFGGGLNVNQQAVANALINFFNSTGGIPLVFGTLTPGGLTQASGEIGTGSQQSTFNAMNQFMGVMTDPFVAGRGDPVSAGGGATGYADEQAMAYAAKRNPNDALAAIYRKAPAVDPFAQRWSVWAAGYGGSQTTSGNAVQGSSNSSSNLYGTAVGADYRFSPDTLAGFALAGGGTNFSVANGLGSGRSDLFQAGAFVRHNLGAAYLSGALAYGWQDITTNRTLTIAGVDQLQAKFNANAWSGRVEGGYRFVTQGLGWTPYAAGQFTTFDLPAYAEQAIVGANTFALAYGARSVTAAQRTRSAHRQIVRNGRRRLHAARPRRLGARLQP
jgi:uncharacterized protein with beta-barrel porin domain